MTTTRVAIIGGGLAGLNAARLLHCAGISFQLFEARDRLGGRILTVDEKGNPAEDGFDLGPSWFWPEMQPALSNLVTELGLPAFAQHSNGDTLFERTARDEPRRVVGLEQERHPVGILRGELRLDEARADRDDVDAARAHLDAQALEVGDRR